MGSVRTELDTSWMTRAACHPCPPGVDFYATDPLGIAKAKAVCAGCTVRADCLAYATARDEFGTWGGLDELERRGRVLISVDTRCPSCGGETVPNGDRDRCLGCGTTWFT